MPKESPDVLLTIPIGQYQDGKMVWGYSLSQLQMNVFIKWYEMLNGDKKEIARVMGIHLKTVYNMYNRYHHRIKRIDDARSMRNVSSEDSVSELRSRRQAEGGTTAVSTSGGQATD
jgi:hypothetical protein